MTHKESFLPSLQRRILREKSVHHLPSSDEGLKTLWRQVLFRGKGLKEKRKQLQVAAKEIPDSFLKKKSFMVALQPCTVVSRI